NEYRDLMRKDVTKQVCGIPALPEDDRDAMLTSVLFALHDEEEVRRPKYRLKRRGRSSSDVEREARWHVRRVIAPFLEREVVEEFVIRLDKRSRVWVFALR